MAVGKCCILYCFLTHRSDSTVCWEGVLFPVVVNRKYWIWFHIQLEFEFISPLRAPVSGHRAHCEQVNGWTDTRGLRHIEDSVEIDREGGKDGRMWGCDMERREGGGGGEEADSITSTIQVWWDASNSWKEERWVKEWKTPFIKKTPPPLLSPTSFLFLTLLSNPPTER